ncbi:MAG TPA: hypothetical protein PK064_10785, partial [Bacteroidales bacterium]|nr:hypothetical protein [Bacteroidales bacterium]
FVLNGQENAPNPLLHIHANRYAPFNTHLMRRLLLIVFLLFSLCNCYSQLLDNSSFRIYRAEFILGTVTHLRLDKDSSYIMSIAEIHCSLCDHGMLENLINSKGTWAQVNDTLYLESPNLSAFKLLIKNDSVLKPLLPIGIDLKQINDTTRKIVLERYSNNSQEDFHLIYDTYPNGVARFIIDRYRARRDEYEIELQQNGSIKEVKYYWDNKQRTRIK